MARELLRCLGLALAGHAGRALVDGVPLDNMIKDICDEAFRNWQLALPDRADRDAELQQLARFTPEEVREEAEQWAGQINPPDVRDAVIEYLERLPSVVRRSLARVDETAAGGAATELVINRAQDLMLLLPLRRPRFKPGYRPPGVNAMLEDLLGVGGFGEVWKARKLSTSPEMYVALKFYHGEDVSRLAGHEAALTRYMNEGRHPGIVALLEKYLDADPPCLEYEYIDGGDLAALIRSWARLPADQRLERSLTTIFELADPVSFLHERGLIHRDLKPANVLIQRGANGNKLCLADLGIAEFGANTDLKTLPTSLKAAVRTMQGAFTPLYAPPEQTRSTPAPADPRDDVYSLAVIFYQMLIADLGKAPEVGFEVALERLFKDGSKEIIEVINTGTDIPKNRFANAALFKQQLLPLLPPVPALEVPPKAIPASPRKQIPGPLGMQFAFVPAGTFWMSQNDKNAQKQETIRDDFQIGIHPVTQGQWQDIMGDNPSYFSKKGGGKDKVKQFSEADLRDFPVENVSWDDTQKFIQRLNEREKNNGWVYRLPTEAEWEYACRACRGGETSKQACEYDFYFYDAAADEPIFTNDLSSDQANFDGNHPAGNGRKGKYLERTTKVGSYQKNALGIYDMHGQVWEWCQDWYEDGVYRVMRGGSWYFFGVDCRAAFRFRDRPVDRGRGYGFRLARSSVG